MKIDTLSITFNNNEPIYKQIADLIKRNILSGRYMPEDILPPSRQLAIDLNISRTSILNAYNLLISQGYINSQRGAGYKINPQSSETKDGKTERGLTQRRRKERYLPFSPEPIDTSFFPSDKWAKIISRIGKKNPASLLYTEHYEKFGSRELRDILSVYLYENKGINCATDQIIITSGSMESIELCVNLLSDPGQQISIEDPCFPPMHSFLSRCVRSLDYMEIDENGASCRNISDKSQLAIVTPGCQFPFGIIMSQERKLDFIQWATNNNRWLIEDDYDSDFNLNSTENTKIFTLDERKRTIYLGSFSRLITSELRIGYIVIPEHLVGKFSHTEYVIKTSYLPQAIIAEFIRSGEFNRNLFKAKKKYADQRTYFLMLLHKYLSAFGHPFESDAGSFVVFMLNPELSDIKVSELAISKGLVLMPLSKLCHKKIQNGFIMGFIYFSHDVLKKAVVQLRDILYTCHEGLC